MFSKEFLRVLCLQTFYQIAFVYDAPMLGPADLNMKKIVQCENPEQYPSYMALERRKINRTHDAFSGDVHFDVDIDETVSLYLNVEKWGDGGYKPNFLVSNKTNVCEFFFKYIKHDIINMLKSMGRPPTCPITAGSTRLVNYSVDYSSLGQDMLYGDFIGRVILVKDDERKLCLEFYAEIKPKSKIIKL